MLLGGCQVKLPMIVGNNSLIINHATMMKAVQFYLDNVVFQAKMINHDTVLKQEIDMPSAITVTAIKATYDQSSPTFTIELEGAK